MRLPLWLREDGAGGVHVEGSSDKIIQRIFSEFLDGISKTEIAHDLAKSGLRLGRSNAKWTGKVVRNVLRDPNVLGDQNLGHPQIVDTSVFETANRIIEKSKSSGGGRLLSHIAFCGYCGGTLSPFTNTSPDSGKKQKSLRCTTAAKSECIANLIPFNFVESHILDILVHECGVRAFIGVLGELEELNSLVVMTAFAGKPSLHRDWPLNKNWPTVEEDDLLDDLKEIRAEIDRLQSRDPAAKRRLRDMKLLVEDYRIKPNREAARKLNAYLLTFIKRIDIAKYHGGDDRIAVSLECDNGFCCRSLHRLDPPRKKTKLWRKLHSETVVTPHSPTKWATEVANILGTDEIPSHIKSNDYLESFLAEKQKRRLAHILSEQSAPALERIRRLDERLSRKRAMLVGGFPGLDPLSKRIEDGKATKDEVEEFDELSREAQDLIRQVWTERRCLIRAKMFVVEKSGDWKMHGQLREESKNVEAHYAQQLRLLIQTEQHALDVALLDGNVRVSDRYGVRERVETLNYYLSYWEEYGAKLLMKRHVDIEDWKVRGEIRAAAAEEIQD